MGPGLGHFSLPAGITGGGSDPLRGEGNGEFFYEYVAPPPCRTSGQKMGVAPSTLFIPGGAPAKPGNARNAASRGTGGIRVIPVPISLRGKTPNHNDEDSAL